MNGQRIVGVALVVVGVILAVVGMNSSRSMADHMSSTFTGRFTDGTMWYLIGGVGLGLLGLLMVVVGRGKATA